MAKTRLQSARVRINEFMARQRLAVFTYTDLRQILLTQRRQWALPDKVTLRAFIDFLLTQTELHRVALSFPKRKEVRYTWGNVDILQVLASIGRRGYFSHFTAMAFHDLTDQIPRVVYLNMEQRPKVAVGASLRQARIDYAFRQKPRVSRNVAETGDWQVCFLNGMHTNSLGVIEPVVDTSRLRFTGIERTLIDISVRPFYAGGVFEVLEAYRRAKDKVDVPALAAMLDKMHYIYPYEQAVGFYLEKAERYRPEEVELFRRKPMRFSFYLTHQMREPVYSERWRIHFPKGF